MAYQNDDNPELPFSASDVSENAVQIMTIHAAKGLEFRAVLVAVTGSAQKGGESAPLLFDPQFGQRPGFGLILGTFENSSTLKKELYRQMWEKPREEAEAKRVFYVALTRAMEKLVVFRGDKSESWTDPSHYPAEQLEIFDEADGRCILETRRFAATPLASKVSDTPDILPLEASVTARTKTESASALRLSFSALNAFDRCPVLYWFRYQWRLPEPPIEEGSNRYATLTGSYLHGLIHKHYLLQGKLNTAEAQKIIQDWLDAEITEVDAENQQKIIGDTLTLYGTFLKSNYAFEHLHAQNYRIYPEQKIRFPWKTRQEKSEFEIMISVDGVMDLLLENLDKNTHTLIDFKTNKKLGTQQQQRYFEQLLLYKHGLKTLWPNINLPDSELILVHLTPQGAKELRCPDATGSSSKLETLIATASATAQQGVFPERAAHTDCHKPHPCPYLSVCPKKEA